MPTHTPGYSVDSVLAEQLRTRLGAVHARQRLGMEADFEARVFGPGLSFFHLENWYSVHALIKNSLKLVGLYGRGRRNTLDLRVRHNELSIPGLPEPFSGFRILHLTDLHVDMNEAAMHRLCECVRDLDYDVCVLTGDYRGKTFGPYEEAITGMRRVRAHLRERVYGVLGNHDTVRMLPELEAMDIRMLVNESTVLERDGSALYLAGIDDAHYYRVDNIEKAAQGIPEAAVSILLAHTPEIYRQAAHAEFDVMLCGHTHGGQICLPGGVPITWEARCPRAMAAGAWSYLDMSGYTSVGAGASIVSVRLNCPPEVVVHRLRPA